MYLCQKVLVGLSCLSHTPPSLTFSDQYAFRPTGSTSAAVIAILQSVTDLLSNNQLVIVLTLDFCKAFDTIRQSS